MTTSEVIVFTRHRSKNKLLKDYELGQVVAVKVTGRVTILRYYHDSIDCCYRLKSRSELYIGDDKGLDINWLLEKYYKSKLQTLSRKPKDRKNYWKLILRYPEGTSNTVYGEIGEEAKFADCNIGEIIRQILKDKNLLLFGPPKRQLWCTEAMTIEAINEEKSLTEEERRFLEELEVKYNI